MKFLLVFTAILLFAFPALGSDIEPRIGTSSSYSVSEINGHSILKYSKTSSSPVSKTSLQYLRCSDTCPEAEIQELIKFSRLANQEISTDIRCMLAMDEGTVVHFNTEQLCLRFEQSDDRLSEMMDMNLSVEEMSEDVLSQMGTMEDTMGTMTEAMTGMMGIMTENMGSIMGEMVNMMDDIEKEMDDLSSDLK